MLLLYSVLHARGWYHATPRLAGMVFRQLIATAVMGVALYLLMPLLADHYGGNVFERAWSLCALVGLGLVTFFGTAWLTGALDRDLIAQLRRRRVAKPAPEPNTNAGKAE